MIQNKHQEAPEFKAIQQKLESLQPPTLDSKFLISKETETPTYEREQKVVEETTKLPITGDSFLLIIALGIIIVMMIFVFIKMKKAKKEADK